MNRLCLLIESNKDGCIVQSMLSPTSFLPYSGLGVNNTTHCLFVLDRNCVFFFPRCQGVLNLTCDLFGTLDWTSVLIKFSAETVPVFFCPLRLHFANSSLLRIASFASDVVRFLKLATSVSGLFCIFCSTDASFGGVLNGGQGILLDGLWLML